jgi:hypothetical protein
MMCEGRLVTEVRANSYMQCSEVEMLVAVETCFLQPYY